MATNKTPNYQLNNWLGTDNVSRIDFNENFTILDTELDRLDTNQQDLLTRVSANEGLLSNKKLIGQYDTPAKLPSGATIGDPALVLNPLSLYMFGRKVTLSTTDAIPELKSDSWSGYTTSSNISGYNAAYGVFRLFNNINDSYFQTTTPSVFPITLKIQLPSAKIFGSYSVQTRNAVTNDTPKTWQLLGSNDNVNWDVLDTRSSESTWGALEKRTYKFNNAKSYKYYQLSVSENHNGISNGQSGNLVLDEMEFFEATFDWGVYDSNLYIEPNKYFQNTGLYGLHLNNSDLVGLNGLYFADPADNSALEGINFLKTGKPANSTDGSHYDNLKLVDGFAYINGKKIMDTGNVVAERVDLKADFTLPGAAQYYNISWGTGQSYTPKGNWSESTNQFTVPTEGIYRIFATVQFKGCTAGNHYYVRLYNVTSGSAVYLGQQTAAGTYVQISGEFQGLLYAGQKYQVEVYSSGGTPSIEAGRTRLSVTSITFS